MEAPLYVMSVGDLGLDSSEVDSSLSNVLEMATKWIAILLLHEADDSLEQRSSHDRECNKFVMCSHCDRDKDSCSAGKHGVCETPYTPLRLIRKVQLSLFVPGIIIYIYMYIFINETRVHSGMVLDQISSAFSDLGLVLGDDRHARSIIPSSAARQQIR